MAIDMPKNIKCPVCKIELNWTATNTLNTFKGSCSKCGIKFTYMNETIISDPKFSK